MKSIWNCSSTKEHSPNDSIDALLYFFVYFRCAICYYEHMFGCFNTSSLSFSHKQKYIRIHFARKSNIIYDSKYKRQLKTATINETSEKKKNDDNDFDDGAKEVVTLCFDLNFKK